MSPCSILGPVQIHLWFRRTCVSLLLKDLTDSDPEPSTIERLGSGPGSGFKWESSVGELLPLSHQSCLALLFFYLTLTFGFYHQLLQTFPFWPDLAVEILCWCVLMRWSPTLYIGSTFGSFGPTCVSYEHLRINESQFASQVQGWWPLYL